MKPLPIATYRLQLNNNFTFTDALGITDYLHDLNISHIYFSPILSSVKGSNHGYDVTDFAAVSPERGSLKGLEEFIKKICAYDNPLKILLDIVPNHMAADLQNPYWRDILKNGPKSEYWNLFDLRIPEGGKIRLPLLATGENDIKVINHEGRKCLQYLDIIFPLNDESLSFDDLENILSHQHYEIVRWTDIKDTVTYRRFFDVAGLIGVRVEEEEIYNLTHNYIFDLLKKFPCIDGLRIDHIDGLAYPKAYLDKLAQTESSVWIEKIISRDEALSPDWKCYGTTGYEFIDRLNQLFVHPENFEKIQSYWLQKTSAKWKNFEDCVFNSKQKALKDLFSPELKRLVAASGGDEDKARLFWIGLTCGLPVYRIYSEQDFNDNQWIKAASATAAHQLGSDYLKAEAEFIHSLSNPVIAKEWQQLSGPVMAKGLEDTAHYRFTPLIALNEVGCAPVIAAQKKSDYFLWIQNRAKYWPAALNATSTHDTKRSEDTRQRLYALADRPEEWISFFETAISLNARFKKNAPSVATEYFIYQSLLGTWPLDNVIDEDYKTRIKNYLQKANREARQETNWADPSIEYEDAINVFIDSILNYAEFITLADDFAKTLSVNGAINSLSVLALKILAPGVPDIYQGCESWNFSLVDPDNRRAVDYSLHQELLFLADNMDMNKNRRELLKYLSENWRDGTIKVWLTRTLLQIRRKHLTYLGTSFKVQELKTSGTYADNLIAYSISMDGKAGLVILCPRYPGMMKKLEGSLKLDWAKTTVQLPGDTFYNLIENFPVTIKSNLVADLFFDIPIAVFSFN